MSLFSNEPWELGSSLFVCLFNNIFSLWIIIGIIGLFQCFCVYEAFIMCWMYKSVWVYFNVWVYEAFEMCWVYGNVYEFISTVTSLWDFCNMLCIEFFMSLF